MPMLENDKSRELTATIRSDLASKLYPKNSPCINGKELSINKCSNDCICNISVIIGGITIPEFVRKAQGNQKP